MDYTYPSIFFSYFIFFLFVCGALYFLVRSVKDGYWGANSEEVKYQMLRDEETEHGGQ